jgi:hypothetical protein
MSTDTSGNTTGTNVNTPLSFFLVSKKDPIENLISELKLIKIPKMSTDKQKASNAFWKAISVDIAAYKTHIANTSPFQKTCYSFCNSVCIHNWDKAYWAYMTVGFRKRIKINALKFPVKILSVFLLFCAGVLKIIRANQDGKASFYGNIITAINHIIVLCLFTIDGEYVMSLPKLVGFVVTIAILVGIANNASDGVGL